LEVSYATLNRWENGRNYPSRLALKELARYCAEKGVSAKIVKALEKLLRSE